MNRRRLILPIALVFLATPFFFHQLAAIPFHPDETSLLVESHDLEILFHSPLELAYEPSSPQSQADEYRALNAPLAKYILGLGRRLAGFGPGFPAADWDWSKTWKQNLAAGALPSEPLLVGARAASTLMALLAIAFIYFAGRSVGGRWIGVAAAVLYASNPLVLLHGRRAMAEGTLLLMTSAAMLATLYAQRRPTAAGIASGLATAAKHSGLALLAVSLFSSSGLFHHDRSGWRRQLPLVLAGFLLVTVVLTPFLWKHPAAAVGRIIQARSELLANQVSTTAALEPAIVLSDWTRRSAGVLGALFVAPLQFQEVGNYQRALAPSIERYRQVRWHVIGRGPLAGGLLFALALLGGLSAARGWLQPRPGERTRLAILAFGTALFGVTIWLANPLPYQRYYVPLVPFVVIWQALGAAALVHAVRELVIAFKPHDPELT